MKSYHRSILSCSLHAKLSGHPFMFKGSIAIEQRFRHLQGEGIPAIDHEIAKLQCLSEQREMVRESWRILESIPRTFDHLRWIILDDFAAVDLRLNKMHVEPAPE